jgi:hypothetical protein
MAYFQTKNPSLGKFWRALQWKMFGIFLVRLVFLRPFGIFCGFYGHLVYFVDFMVIWYIFHVLVCCNKKNLATLREWRKMRSLIMTSAVSSAQHYQAFKTKSPA